MKLNYNRIIKIKGYFHESEILIEDKNNGIDGYIIIKPFSFVGEKNPSSGWPSWFALDSILVNVGWIPKKGINQFYKKIDYKDQIFTDPITIYGIYKNVDNNQYSTIHTEVFKNKKYDLQLLWDFLN